MSESQDKIQSSNHCGRLSLEFDVSLIRRRAGQFSKRSIKMMPQVEQRSQLASSTSERKVRNTLSLPMPITAREASKNLDHLVIADETSETLAIHGQA